MSAIPDMTRLWAAWEAWAPSADHGDAGWESNFPDWDALMTSAKSSLVSELSGGALKVMENCWAASHENEELLDFARDRIADCWSNLEKLAESPLGACRWQVYAAAPAIGRAAEGMLRRGLKDSDDYVRRRAALALASLVPSDAGSLARDLATDSDPYIRQAAVEMALSSPDFDVRRSLHALLSHDDVEHVRTASKRLAMADE